MNKNDIDLATQNLLKFSDEAPLTKTIWGLSAEQKHSPIFKEIGQQRYLSALRAGAIDNAEMTKAVFTIDPYFLKSRIVTEAAIEGLKLKIRNNDTEAAGKIRKTMNLPEEL